MIAIGALLLVGLGAGGFLLYADRTHSISSFAAMEAQLKAAQATLQTDQVSLKKADDKYNDALQQLSAMQVENTKLSSDLTAAKTALDSARSDLESARSELSSTKEKLANEHAKLLATPKDQGASKNSTYFGITGAPGSTNSTGPAGAPAAPPPPKLDPQTFAPMLATINGDKKSGSGFIVNLKDGPRLITSFHVLSGNTTANIATGDGKSLTPTSVQIAEGPDLASLAADPATKGLDLLPDLVNNLAVGDEVAVITTSAGAATQIKGKITTISPSQLELDAKFAPENSGSPVIQVKSGKVIGVATYNLEGQVDDAATDASRIQYVEHRFATRLDNVPGWKELTWDNLVRESLYVQGIADQTNELLFLIKDIYIHGGVTYQHYYTDGNSLKGPVGDLESKLTHDSTGDTYYQDAKTDFLASAKDLCEKDIATLNLGNFLPYHQEWLQELIEERHAVEKSLTHLSGIQDTTAVLGAPHTPKTGKKTD